MIVARPVEVRTPVYEPVYCASEAPPRPALPIAELKPDSSPAAAVKAYAASVALLKAAVVAREDLLAACAAPDKAVVEGAPGNGSAASIEPAQAR